ncbi:hypothetical protein DRE_04871 [Drechslerella stenobrocha 248]|uniref:UDP-N-acetylglucosamine transferase subunit ALG14 n=1 Tax=Drechslerella stenobrocha 248 TaxID=1043628 RepID=W7HRN5_9PEZI|nr:hypothetical protein DRE_04871 [Drechslerella stenobrocha 248]
MISLAFAVAFALFILVILLVSLRIHAILPEDQPSFVTEISQASRIVEITTPARSHVLFILGSGGHTTEMLSLIQDIPLETATHRTFVFSSGDTHSAQKAQSFEESHFGTRNSLTKEGRGTGAVGYRLIEIPRARRVRQSLLTTPWTCLLCLRKCLDVVSGGDMAAMPKDERESWKGMEFPDVVVCNGPATAVMLVLACYIFKSDVAVTFGQTTAPPGA